MGPGRKQDLPGTLEVVGGAKFADGIVVSWPLVKAIASETGITVAVRGKRRWAPLSFSCTWKELRSADARWRGIVLHGPSGVDVTFGNMFAPERLRLMVEEVRRRGIPVHE